MRSAARLQRRWGKDKYTEDTGGGHTGERIAGAEVQGFLQAANHVAKMSQLLAATGVRPQHGCAYLGHCTSSVDIQAYSVCFFYISNMC